MKKQSMTQEEIIENLKQWANTKQIAIDSLLKSYEETKDDEYLLQADRKKIQKEQIEDVIYMIENHFVVTNKE